jgi:hypothetical protein
MSDVKQYWLQSMMGGGQGGSQPLPVPGASSPSPSPDYNPMGEGINLGMKAARQSYEMDREQKQDALQSAMSIFFSGLGKTGYGNGMAGSLNALNAGINPAIQNYLAQKDKFREQNREHVRYLTREQRELAREAREDRRLNKATMLDMAKLQHSKDIEERQLKDLQRREKWDEGQLARLNRTEDRQLENLTRQRRSDLAKQKIDIDRIREAHAENFAKNKGNIFSRTWGGEGPQRAYEAGLKDFDKRYGRDIQTIDRELAALDPYSNQDSMPSLDFSNLSNTDLDALEAKVNQMP